MRAILVFCRRLVIGQDSHAKDVLRGATRAGVLKAASAALAFGLNVVLGRSLGAAGAGLYFLALTIATIAATIGRLGLDSAVVRSISSSASCDNWDAITRFHRAALTIGLVCSTIVAVLLVLSSTYMATYVFSNAGLVVPIRIMAIAIVPLTLGVLVSRSLQGLSRIRDSVLVFSVLPYGVALAATWILAKRVGVNGAIVGYVVAVLAAFLYGCVAWQRHTRKHLRIDGHAGTGAPARDLLRSAPPLLIGALLQLVMTMSGTLMLGMWAPSSEVSLFAVAWRTAFLISFVLLAVNTIAQPKFAALFARRDLEALSSTARKTTIMMTIAATPAFLLLLILPGPVMGVFGREFVDGASALQILAVGQFFNVAAGSVGIMLLMSHCETEYRNVQIASACLVLVLNCLLIPAFGSKGAAIASAAALIVQNILFGYFVWVRLGIQMLPGRQATHRQRVDK